MMTSVVACGNGHLSGRPLCGLAPEAKVVLVRCGSARRIAHDDIRKGHDWVVRHRRNYGIRVVNVSRGGDGEAPYAEDPLSRSAEAAVEAGLLVVAAVGNVGLTAGTPSFLPPPRRRYSPSAPSTTRTRPVPKGYDIYHGGWGPTGQPSEAGRSSPRNLARRTDPPRYADGRRGGAPFPAGRRAGRRSGPDRPRALGDLERSRRGRRPLARLRLKPTRRLGNVGGAKLSRHGERRRDPTRPCVCWKWNAWTGCT